MLPSHSCFCSISTEPRGMATEGRERRERLRGKGKKERRRLRFSIGCGCSGRAAHSSELEQLRTPLTAVHWLTLTCSLVAAPSARQRQSVVRHQSQLNHTRQQKQSPHLPSSHLTSPPLRGALPQQLHSHLSSRSPCHLLWRSCPIQWRRWAMVMSACRLH